MGKSLANKDNFLQTDVSTARLFAFFYCVPENYVRAFWCSLFTK